MTAIEITLAGDFQSDSSSDLFQRARLLDLRGWVSQQDETRMTILVAGPDSLIGAMEMACSLGPVDIEVDRIDSRPRRLSEALNGFYKR